MAEMPPNVIERYVGDDWTVGPITLYGSGRAIDLTGATVSALFYARDVLGPVASLSEAEAPDVGGVTVAADRTQGTITEAWIAAAVTANVRTQDRRDPHFWTRLAILVTDSLGRERTYALVLFRPLDRRSDVPPGCAGAP